MIDEMAVTFTHLRFWRRYLCPQKAREICGGQKLVVQGIN
jgi:hypothetical protein